MQNIFVQNADIGSKFNMANCGGCGNHIGMFSAKRNCRTCKTSYHDNGKCVKVKSIISNQLWCARCGAWRDSTVG